MLVLIGTVLGGLGLFLLAVSMISDGLKLAAGGALRDILARSTATRWRGVASGIVVTGVVQSSSAVTVATIGFVNAGLLNLSQALGIVYGSNVGTTMTGWLVAAVGFKLKVDAFALPMIGAGMFLRLVGATTRLGACGEALAGFGLFFIGIDVLRGAFEGLAVSLDVATLVPSGVAGLLGCLGLGFLMTLLTQSSSAAIAMTLTAASGGALTIEAAAAMVIGANVGTTSTAAFAVIGATPNARRVASAHVAFNLLSGVVALLLLPVLLRGVQLTESLLGLAAQPAVTLALFHTTFNVLGVALMWPLTPPLVRFLRRRFRTLAETLAQPAHLDQNVLATPSLALDALRLELARMAGIARRHATAALGGGTAPAERAQERDALHQLGAAVEQFVTRLERQRLPATLARSVPNALRINGYIEEVATLAEAFAARADDIAAIRRAPVADDIAAYLQAAARLLMESDPATLDFDSAELEQDYVLLRGRWHDLKGVLLEAASDDTIPVAALNPALEGLRAALRMAEQTIKLATRLRHFDRGGEAAPAEPGPLAETPTQKPEANV